VPTPGMSCFLLDIKGVVKADEIGQKIWKKIHIYLRIVPYYGLGAG